MCHRYFTCFMCGLTVWTCCVCKLTFISVFFFRVCSQVSCPYSDINLNKEGLLPDRLGTERPLTLPGLHPRGRRPDQNTNTQTQSSSTPDADHTQNRYAAEGKGWKSVKASWISLESLQQSQENACQCFACDSILSVCTWEWVFCVARKPGIEEAEQSGCNSQPEPIGGASEQSQNGTRPKRYCP